MNIAALSGEERENSDSVITHASNLITDAQLKGAHHAADSRLLGEVLVQYGALNEQDLARALAAFRLRCREPSP